MKVTVVIPNYNGKKYINDCMDALAFQMNESVKVIVVDNGSTDGSVEVLREEYSWAGLVELGENTGFCNAVNVGIRLSETPYVILLNNDTVIKSGFINNLVSVMEKPGNEKVFSVSSKMVDMYRPEIVDDAGDRYSALGWAFSRGKGKDSAKYNVPVEVFAACGGAAIYRRSVFDEIGFFDELHFAYLEDLDIGYRAGIFGYRNLYEPTAEVLHAGSGSSGSRYNEFKTKHSSANSTYIIWKNMPVVQRLLNWPFFIIGFGIKALFFAKKKMGLLYIKGCISGVTRRFLPEARSHKVPFRWRHMANYCRIQWQLWLNVFRRIWE